MGPVWEASGINFRFIRDHFRDVFSKAIFEPRRGSRPKSAGQKLDHRKGQIYVSANTSNAPTPCGSKRVRTILRSPPLYYVLNPPLIPSLGIGSRRFKKLIVPFYDFWATFFDVKSAAPRQGVPCVLNLENGIRPATGACPAPLPPASKKNLP